MLKASDQQFEQFFHSDLPSSDRPRDIIRSEGLMCDARHASVGAYHPKNRGSPVSSQPIRCFTPPRSSLCLRME